MAHIVKCSVCGEKFNRDVTQAVKSGARRYAHQRCMPDGELVPLEKPIDEDLVSLENYISQLLGKDYNPARVKKQIKEYKEQYGYTYSGMLKTLTWWYEIKGNSKEKAQGGIGIIPFIYKDASNYYYSLYLANLANESILSKPKRERKVIEVVISPPTANRKPLKLFNIEEDE